MIYLISIERLRQVKNEDKSYLLCLLSKKGSCVYDPQAEKQPILYNLHYTKEKKNKSP